ncbi:hypothetical protein E3N88_15786 [Mikania micrantha]|uniref:Uncharacterized protein n=1 Tax=Mikania micrantha TaxID=192012 RepID=A0A5N6NZ56_9ASTR|nr:hypothetical protein E3N88_15786 [Mikania micrantha]
MVVSSFKCGLQASNLQTFKSWSFKRSSMASKEINQGVAGVSPGVGELLCALRADLDGRGAQIPPARIACRGCVGLGVPPGLNFKPNKLVLLFWAHSCSFLDHRTSFERRLDSIGQVLAIIDL